jgi:hypothetical protein
VYVATLIMKPLNTPRSPYYETVNMLNHVVKQGECLSSISSFYGLHNWRTIYYHPNNGDFRRRRPDPNILYPGDVLYIPDREPKYVAAATDRCHTFEMKKLRVSLSLFLEDPGGKPLQNKRYCLRIGRLTYNGETTAEGWVKHEIPGDATEGTLTIYGCGAGYTWDLKLGNLDPHTENSGISQRLANMGFDRDPNNECTDQLRNAVADFQKQTGLPVNGKLDSTTRERIRARHDKT